VTKNIQEMAQWECLQKNLGCWQGYFSRLSPQGQIREDIPSELILEELNDRNTIRLTLRQFYPDPHDQRSQVRVIEFWADSPLGRSILFFPNGEFSQGSTQLGVAIEFGAEFSFIAGSRRSRLVQQFDQQGNLDTLTLIREKLAESNVPERPHLELNDLLGTWIGEAIAIYPDGRSPHIYPTKLQLTKRSESEVAQTVTFGDPPQSFTSAGKINDAVINFNAGTPVQVVLLQDGASSVCPVQVKLGQPLFLEAGWLIQPDLRHRMIRSYDRNGAWTSLTLITERKVLAD
jgi:hypothetical protein